MSRIRFAAKAAVVVSIASVIVFSSLTSMAIQASELTRERFQELHRQLQVDAEAPWRTIPWKMAVLDAQRTAAEQSKPIFIWAMDGHPLGCT